jgi:hypothetical protein
MHGELNDAADITPEFAAEKINALVENYNSYDGKTALYMDLFGKRLEW